MKEHTPVVECKILGDYRPYIGRKRTTHDATYIVMYLYNFIVWNTTVGHSNVIKLIVWTLVWLQFSIHMSLHLTGAIPPGPNLLTTNFRISSLDTQNSSTYWICIRALALFFACLMSRIASAAFSTINSCRTSAIRHQDAKQHGTQNNGGYAR